MRFHLSAVHKQQDVCYAIFHLAGRSKGAVEGDVESRQQNGELLEPEAECSAKEAVAEGGPEGACKK